MVEIILAYEMNAPQGVRDPYDFRKYFVAAGPANS